MNNVLYAGKPDMHLLPNCTVDRYKSLYKTGCTFQMIRYNNIDSILSKLQEWEALNGMYVNTKNPGTGFTEQNRVYFLKF